MTTLVENFKDLDLEDELVVVSFDDIEEYFLNNERVLKTDKESQETALCKIRKLLEYHRSYREDGELGKVLLIDKQALLSSIVFEALTILETVEKEEEAK